MTSEWIVPETGSFAYQLQYTSEGVTTVAGTIIIDKTSKVGADSWSDYVMIGYTNLHTTPANANHRIGFIMRYQDTDNYYFVGYKIETTGGGSTNNKSTYEVYKKESGSYSRIANHFDTGNNYSGGSELYYGLPNSVGTDGVLTENTQYHTRVEMYGKVCRFYISNVLVFENTTDFDLFTKGEIGMEAYTQNNEDIKAYFDTIRVVV